MPAQATPSCGTSAAVGLCAAAVLLLALACPGGALAQTKPKPRLIVMPATHIVDDDNM